jgi:hypothetical protein
MFIWCIFGLLKELNIIKNKPLTNKQLLYLVEKVNLIVKAFNSIFINFFKALLLKHFS